MATMNISLPDEMKTWVDGQAGRGRFSDASEYVRDLIRRDRERQLAIETLQSAITEGLESGPPQPFDATEFKLRMRDRHAVK